MKFKNLTDKILGKFHVLKYIGQRSKYLCYDIIKEKLCVRRADHLKRLALSQLNTIKNINKIEKYTIKLQKPRRIIQNEK